MAFIEKRKYYLYNYAHSSRQCQDITVIVNILVFLFSDISFQYDATDYAMECNIC